MKTVDLEVVIPAYNEQDRISRTLARVKEYYDGQTYTWRCTVVSDGSTDKTTEVVTEFCNSNPEFHLEAYEQNRGKGYAVRLGMLKANADRVLFCDADLATPQEETEKLWKALDDGYDVAIGSRPLKESKLEVHQPWMREHLGRVFNKAVQLLAVKGIDDTQCGFKMFTQRSAQDIFSTANSKVLASILKRSKSLTTLNSKSPRYRSAGATKKVPRLAFGGMDLGCSMI